MDIYNPAMYSHELLMDICNSIMDIHNSIMDIHNSIMGIHNSFVDFYNSQQLRISMIPLWISIIQL